MYLKSTIDKDILVKETCSRKEKEKALKGNYLLGFTPLFSPKW